MLDSRDNAPIRFERVNAETGEEVPWKEIVKAFEYEKGNYVVLEQEDIKAAPRSRETVEIQAFVERDEIDPLYFEKPYYLVPGKKAEKGYVLLREVLAKTAGRHRRSSFAPASTLRPDAAAGRAGHGAAALSAGDRLPGRVLPSGKAEAYRVSDKELEDGRATDRIDGRQVSTRASTRTNSAPPPPQKARKSTRKAPARERRGRSQDQDDAVKVTVREFAASCSAILGHQVAAPLGAAARGVVLDHGLRVRAAAFVLPANNQLTGQCISCQTSPRAGPCRCLSIGRDRRRAVCCLALGS